MQAHNILVIVVLCATFAVGCSQCQVEEPAYQEIWPAIKEGNGLLMVKYPNGLTEPVTDLGYKSLLREKRAPLDERLEEYNLVIEPVGNNFIVKVYFEGNLILLDASCTEVKADCWVYMSQCTDETLSVPCLVE